jgi:uncharacterized protein YfaS (alpha-2-macroglobulin family)
MVSTFLAHNRITISRLFPGGNRAQRTEVTPMKLVIQLFAGLLVFCASSAAMAQNAGGGMRISVASKETQRPLEGVTVTVTDRFGNVIARRTEVSGTVDLTGLDAGLYAVTADGPAWLQSASPAYV